jgi:hypothetical protein
MEIATSDASDELVQDTSTAIILNRRDLEKQHTVNLLKYFINPFQFDDLETLQILTGHNGPVRFIIIHEGKLYSASDDCRILVWDAQVILPYDKNSH